VREVVRYIEATYPQAACNTYVGHPWRGWGRVSVDVWGPGGRGDPIGYDLGWKILGDVFNNPANPALRHTIYIHQLWTSFGGYSWWAPADHSGRLRHVHLTFWK
jgi:hypothetical protein